MASFYGFTRTEALILLNSRTKRFRYALAAFLKGCTLGALFGFIAFVGMKMWQLDHTSLTFTDLRDVAGAMILGAFLLGITCWAERSEALARLLEVRHSAEAYNKLMKS